ncbi:uncharacterized protein isoform X8 [Danio rerio]|uniref:Uncharacterized protein isoform X8 n=1 Tax=Danio rerio TaxID=7955 RepID=A0AC58GGJ9_DANRE
MFVGGGDAQEVCVKCRGPSGDLLFSQRGLNSISREADPDPFTSCCLSEVIFFDLLSVSGSDVTDPTGIVKIQWRLKTHMRFWNKYDGLLNQVVKAWRIGRSSEKKKSSGNGTQIWNIMRVLLLHDNRWKNKGSEKVLIRHIHTLAHLVINYLIFQFT